jgi:hypothetical protein
LTTPTVIAGLIGANTVVLGIGGDRLLEVASAHVINGALLPGLDLPAIDGEFAGAQPLAEGAEAAAGLDGGELPVVADQRHLGTRPLRIHKEGSELLVVTMAASSTTSTVRSSNSVLRCWRSSSSRSTVRASVKPSSARATVAIPVGAVPRTLVAVQLERLSGQPQRPGFTAASSADDDRDAGAALGEVADHLRPDQRTALLSAAGGAVHELPLEGQQFRRRVAVDAQPAVAADPHRPLLEEPVGRRLDLGECLLGGGGDREPLG